MTKTVKGTKYYRTAEVCQLAGISRTTLFRWLKNDFLGETVARDRRGWRLFTEEDVDKLKAEANRIDQPGM
ncbi:regulatory protein MerR [Dehalogenimonas lykanthroporepellens BL-DC-9]|jgi:predicted site-specific integrase-resolvase|nr:regulatory protein MerR [Dehalogenimonas lykanthroporepellens BL-DC-9]